MSLRRLDLNLLTVFEAVYEELSQQKASERLFMSQPAISNSISRLRTIIGDRLFFGNKTIQTTTRADELYIQIHEALHLVRSEIITKSDFTPAETKRTFNIMFCYGQGFMLGAALYQRFKKEAPNASLVIKDLESHEDIPRALREQQIDLAVSQHIIKDPMIEGEHCLEFNFCVVVSKNHPRITSQPTNEALQREGFIWVSDSTFPTDIPELQQLARELTKNIKLEVPSSLVIPSILSDTDLVAIMPLSYAGQLSRHYELNIFKLDINQLIWKSKLLWHRAFITDPAVSWFKELCSSEFRIIRETQSHIHI
jgi:LysR family transcriptional activator for leuABCD operon